MADGILEMEALLAPLADGDGGGEDAREDASARSPYQLLRGARSEARDEERRVDGGDPNADTVAALSHWREVKKLSIAILTTKSKDFAVAAWLTEALVRIDGLPGLEAGSRLITGLVQNFWEKGFPRLEEEDGLDDRASPIGGLAGQGADGMLMQPLRRMTLFRRGDSSPCDLFLYKRAEDTAAIVEEERRERRYKEGVPQLDVLQREGRADGAFLRAVALQALAAREAWQAMDQALNDPFAGNSPSTRNVTETLTTIIDLATRIIGPLQSDAPLPEPGGEEAGPDGGGADTGTGGGPATGGGGGPGGPRPLRTRDDAIKQIEELSAFFKKTEPHSPVAFTLEDAARRARMPLTELLLEVLPEGEARKAMLTRLGIHQPEG